MEVIEESVREDANVRKSLEKTFGEPVDSYEREISFTTSSGTERTGKAKMYVVEFESHPTLEKVEAGRVVVDDGRVADRFGIDIEDKTPNFGSIDDIDCLVNDLYNNKNKLIKEVTGYEPSMPNPRGVDLPEQ